MELIGLKLTTGQEIIGYAAHVSWRGDVSVFKPMHLRMTDENAISLQPYAPYSQSTVMVFPAKHIISTFPPYNNLAPVFDAIWNNMTNTYQASLLAYNERINPTITAQQQRREPIMLQQTDLSVKH